jgi:hypothetical protein
VNGPPWPGAAARAVWTRSRRWLPWVVAASILAALAARLPHAQLLHALATGPATAVALCSAAVAAAVLLADAWATLRAFAVTGVRCPWRGLLLARGATYLLGLINFAVGQGGMGLYLHRAGVGPLRALGMLLFLMGTQIAALAAVAAVGVAAQTVISGAGGAAGAAGAAAGAAGAGGASGAGAALAGSLPLLAAFAIALALYFGLLSWRPDWLARRPVLAPVFAAGSAGFLSATAARLPHALVLVLGWWLGLRIWGIPLPPAQGLVVLSVAVLVAVLPVAPSGIGTLELALVQLVSPYAPGATAAAQRADVLAFALVYHLFGLAAQALIGLLCLAAMTRRARAGAGGGGGGAGGPQCIVAPLPAAGRARVERSPGSPGAPGSPPGTAAAPPPGPPGPPDPPPS